MFVGCHGLPCPRIDGDLEEVVVWVMYRVKLHRIQLHHACFGVLPVAEGARVVEKGAGAETNSTWWIDLVGRDGLELEVGFLGGVRGCVWRGVPIQYLGLGVWDA